MVYSSEQALATLKKHGRSFYFGSHLLGHVYRDRAARLYTFCRYVDDLVDESNDFALAAHNIEELKQSLFRKDSAQPVVRQMISLMQEVNIPTAPVLSLIEGVGSDLDARCIQDEAELIQYAYQVAGTVGLMMCKVLDVNDARAWPFAIDLGIAMQLTNIARDVGEDAEKGRVYLPACWIGKTRAAEILNSSELHTNQIMAGTQRILALAEQYYQSGFSGLVYLPPAARYGVLVAAAVYRDIGREVTRLGLQAISQRAVVPKSRKLVCAVRSLIDHWIQSSTIKPAPTHNTNLHQSLQHCYGANPSDLNE